MCIGNAGLVADVFDAEARFDVVAVAHIPHARRPGFGFQLLRGFAVVGKRACPVVAVVLARLADAQCHGLFVFVAGGDEGAGVAFIEQVVVVVTELAAQTVFGIVAEAEFELVFFHFRHGYFYRHAVAFQTVEIGLYGRAGIVTVLLQSLLVVEQFVQIVRRTCVELRQSAHDAGGIAFVAADFKFAEVNRPPAVHRYR